MSTFNESTCALPPARNERVGINRLPKGGLHERFDLVASKLYMSANRPGSIRALHFKLCLTQLFQYLYFESDLAHRADFSLLQERREVSTPWGAVSVCPAPAGDGEKGEAQAGGRPDILVTSPAECFFVRRDCSPRRMRRIFEEMCTRGFALSDGRKLPGMLSWAKVSLVRCDAGWKLYVSFTVPTDVLEAMFEFGDTVCSWSINE